MDAETISTLRTVCVAGSANSGFNAECNARLEQLAEEGFLVVVKIAKGKAPRSAYKPTEKGKELFRHLSAHGAA